MYHHSRVTTLFNAPLHNHVLHITVGYAVVVHNKTITSSQKGVTTLANQQQSSATATVDDDKVSTTSTISLVYCVYQ